MPEQSFEEIAAKYQSEILVDLNERARELLAAAIIKADEDAKSSLDDDYFAKFEAIGEKVWGELVPGGAISAHYQDDDGAGFTANLDLRALTREAVKNLDQAELNQLRSDFSECLALLPAD